MPLRVLVVENERNIADTLGSILRSNGYDTKVVYTGEDAVASLEEFRPEVLVSDVLMPGMSGIELASFVWNNVADCKVMLVSGDGELVDLMDHTVGRRHFVKVLTKPVHPDTILEFLASC